MLTCANALCGQDFEPKQLLGIGIYNGGLGVTPCCRHLYWYGSDGHLAGKKMEQIFCEKCRRYIGEAEFEPILKKQIPRPKVWHDRCSPERDEKYEFEALELLHDLEYDIQGIVKTMAWYQSGKKSVSPNLIDRIFWQTIMLLAREARKGKVDFRELSKKVLLSGIWDKKFKVKRKIDPRWRIPSKKVKNARN